MSQILNRNHIQICVRDQDDLPLLDAVQSHSRQEKRTQNKPKEESLFCRTCRVTNLNPNFHIFEKQILCPSNIQAATEYSTNKKITHFTPRVPVMMKHVRERDKQRLQPT